MRINSITGSTIIRYDADAVSADQLLQLLADHGYYKGSTSVKPEEIIERAATNAIDHVGRAVFGWAVSRALDASGFSLLAALI